MSEKKRAAIRRDWFSKTAAGVVWGGVLAMGSSGLLSHLCADLPLTIRGQLAMWLTPPIWLAVLGGVYFFSSGWRAWLCLGTASLLLCGLLLWLRQG